MLINYLSLISNIFDQKFERFYLPLIGLFLGLLLINCIYYVHFFVYSYNEWLVADWLINYSGGIVRRGLSGELIFFITNLFNWNTLHFLFYFLSFLQVLLFLGIFILIFNKKITFWFFLIFATPSFLSFYFFDPAIIARKEILIYLSYFAWMVTLLKKRQITFRTSLSFSILGAFITLLHEIFVFYSIAFYLFSIIYYEQKLFTFNFSIFIPLSSVVTLIFLMLAPTAFNAVEICQRITEAGIDPKVCLGGVLSWPANGVIEGFILNLSIYNIWTPFGLILILMLPLSSISLFCASNKLLNRSAKKLFFCLILQLIFMSPLFLVATDWGRWVNIQSILLGLSMVFFLESNKSFEIKDLKYSTTAKLWGYGVPIILLIFMSSWNLKHCCRDGNFLFEFNGLVGSFYSIIL
jgi:hypothetical protein